MATALSRPQPEKNSTVHPKAYEESKRLARPILFMVQHGVSISEEWAPWYTNLGSSKPLNT